PMDQVSGNSMAPMHVSPSGPVRVVLEKEMVFAVIIRQSIRVIVPTVPRGKVELTAKRFPVDGPCLLHAVCLYDRAVRLAAGIQRVHAQLQFSAPVWADIQIGIPVCLPFGQCNAEPSPFIVPRVKFDKALGGAVLDRELQIMPLSSKPDGERFGLRPNGNRRREPDGYEQYRVVRDLR